MNSTPATRFAFSFPTPTLCGAGVLSELPAQLAAMGVKRPLVVTDPGLLPTQAFQKLRAVLGNSSQGVSWHLYSGVHPNPVEQDVRESAEACVRGGCDGVVAFGGGSALDTGKAARILVRRPGLDLARFYDHSDWGGLMPLVAIPTTAGTGSEVGRSSVITLDSTRRKAVLFHRELLARCVFLDPELTFDLPPKLTAATGADALTHCIESFTCPVFHPMCDGIALEGIRLVVESLPKACANGKDVEARMKMLVAAAMGAVAFQKDLGVVHSLAHPLSSLFGMHHGLANALCLVAGMKFCAERAPGIYRRVGQVCDLPVEGLSDREADLLTIDFVEKFLGSIGLRGRLREHDAKEEQLEALVAQAVEDPCHKTNVVPVTAEDFRNLYRAVI